MEQLQPRFKLPALCVVLGRRPGSAPLHVASLRGRRCFLVRHGPRGRHTAALPQAIRCLVAVKVEAKSRLKLSPLPSPHCSLLSPPLNIDGAPVVAAGCEKQFDSLRRPISDFHTINSKLSRPRFDPGGGFGAWLSPRARSSAGALLDRAINRRPPSLTPAITA